MTVLRLEPLRSLDASEYWRVYVAGRNDLPTTSVTAHLDRYLGLPAEEQRTYYGIRRDGAIVGTVRLLPDTITGFSMDPSYAEETRPAIIRSIDLLRSGGAAVLTASFDETYSRDFEAVGFRPVFSRMRMEAATMRQAPLRGTLKPPEEAEIVGLAQFFSEVYAGHMEQEYGMHVGAEADWRGYIAGILRGETGRFMPDASFVSLEGKRLVGAILVSHWMGSPLIGELGVAKDRRRRGIARDLLSAASTRLASLGESHWSLYVTVGNEPAIALYRASGFTQAGSRTVTARRDAPVG